MVDEKRLLERLKKRQKNSIEQAIEIYTPYVSTVLFNIAGTKLPVEDIEEIVADVFVMLWKNAEYIDLHKGTIRSYIAATARNLAIKRLNRQIEFTAIEDIELPDESVNIEDTVFSEILWRSVIDLGEPDSEIFIRYYKYGEKLKDISQRTGLNLSTIKSKLSRGKHKLKKSILNMEESL